MYSTPPPDDAVPDLDPQTRTPLAQPPATPGARLGSASLARLPRHLSRQSGAPFRDGDPECPRKSSAEPGNRNGTHKFGVFGRTRSRGGRAVRCPSAVAGQTGVRQPVNEGSTTTAVGAVTISPPTMTGMVVVAGGAVVVVVVVLGGLSQVTCSVIVDDLPVAHCARRRDADRLAGEATRERRDVRVAAPEPVKPGGVSVVVTVWKAPLPTLTCHTIGWSAGTNSMNLPDTVVQAIEVR